MVKIIINKGRKEGRGSSAVGCILEFACNEERKLGFVVAEKREENR